MSKLVKESDLKSDGITALRVRVSPLLPEYNLMKDNYTKAKEYFEDGLNFREISQILKVHKSTVSYWARNSFKITNPKLPASAEALRKCCVQNKQHYSYIIGCYLGDGCISKLQRTYKLRISSSTAHPDIIKQRKRSLEKIFPLNKVAVSKIKSAECVEIRVHNSGIPIIFPRHGNGAKHKRNITLEDWQSDIIYSEPECFIKGLIDTDGSYFIVNGKYRYRFTNKSKQIANLYMEVMSHLGISAKPTIKSDGVINIFTNAKIEVEKLDKLYSVADNKLNE